MRRSARYRKADNRRSSGSTRPGRGAGESPTHEQDQPRLALGRLQRDRRERPAGRRRAGRARYQPVADPARDAGRHLHGSRVARPAVRKSWLRKGSRRRRTAAAPSRSSRCPGTRRSTSSRPSSSASKPRTATRRSSRGSYGWASAGRFHHAKSQLHRFLNWLRRLHRARSTTTGSPPAWRSCRTSSATDQSAARSATCWAVHRANTELVVAFGGLPPKNAQVEPAAPASTPPAPWLRARRRRRRRVRLIAPVRDDIADVLDAEWLAVRAQHRHRADAGAGPHARQPRGCTTATSSTATASASTRFARYLLGARRRPPKAADWAAAIYRDRGRHDPRAGPPRWRRAARMITLSWSLQRGDHGEQPLLDGDRAGRHARPDRPAGRRLRLRLRLDRHGHRRPRRLPAAPTLDQGRNPVGSCHPGRAHRRHAAEARRRLSSTTAARDLSRHPPGLLGRRQSVPPPPGPQPAASTPGSGPRRSSSTSRGGRRRRATPTSCCRRPRRSSATTSAPASRDRFIVAMQQAVDAGRRGPQRLRHLRRPRRAARRRATPSPKGRDEMDWLRHSTTRPRSVRASTASTLPDFDGFWERRQRRAAAPPTRPACMFDDFRADPDGASAGDAVGPDRDLLRDDRRLRLRRLPRPSGLARAGRMARRATRRDAIRCT